MLSFISTQMVAQEGERAEGIILMGKAFHLKY